MKKALICLALSGAFLLLSACGTTQESEEIKPWAATDPETTAVSEVLSTRQQELSTMEAMTEKMGDITLPAGVKAEDIEKLENMLWPHFYYHDFNRDTADPMEPLSYISDSNVPWGIFAIFRNIDPDGVLGKCERLSIADVPDPKGVFGDTYFKVEESAVDFVLTEFFGGTPLHTVQEEHVYYHDGCYYFRCDPAGIEDYGTKIHACQALENGHYRLTTELQYIDMDGTTAHEASAFIEAAIAQQKGIRYWQIYSVEVFE